MLHQEATKKHRHSVYKWVMLMLEADNHLFLEPWPISRPCMQRIGREEARLRLVPWGIVLGLKVSVDYPQVSLRSISVSHGFEE